MRRNVVIFMLCCLLLIYSCVFTEDTVTCANLDNNDNIYKQAVHKLCKMNIIEEEQSESFMTDKLITRAEAAVLVVKFAGYGNMVESGSYSSGIAIFKDVKKYDWFSVYLYAGCSIGITVGYDNRYFYPNDYVTYEQIIKMIIVALGYGVVAPRYGGYPQGFLKVAEDLGITKSIGFVPDAYATKKHIAAMLYQALFCPIAVQSSGPPLEDGFLPYCILDGTDDDADCLLITAEMQYYMRMSFYPRDSRREEFFVLDSENVVLLRNKDVVYTQAINTKEDQCNLEIFLTDEAKGKLSEAIQRILQLPLDKRRIKFVYRGLIIAQMEVTEAMDIEPLHISSNLTSEEAAIIVQEMNDFIKE